MYEIKSITYIPAQNKFQTLVSFVHNSKAELTTCLTDAVVTDVVALVNFSDYKIAINTAIAAKIDMIDNPIIF